MHAILALTLSLKEEPPSNLSCRFPTLRLEWEGLVPKLFSGHLTIPMEKSGFPEWRTSFQWLKGLKGNPMFNGLLYWPTFSNLRISIFIPNSHSKPTWEQPAVSTPLPGYAWPWNVFHQLVHDLELTITKSQNKLNIDKFVLVFWNGSWIHSSLLSKSPFLSGTHEHIPYSLFLWAFWLQSSVYKKTKLPTVFNQPIPNSKHPT